MNPFKYGKEVTGYQFYDRRKCSKELYQTLADGSSNVVLYAPRRYGKTSMVLKVLEAFKADGTKTLNFDMSRVGSIERFCALYASSVYALWGGVPELVNQMKEYLVHLHPTFSFGDSLIPKITFDYGERMNALAISEVLELPEKLSEASGNEPVVVAFDEFQDVAELSRQIPLEATFRSVIQAHRNVRYVFLGSKTHLMKRMFGTRSRPFYKSALTMKIGKPPIAESEEFVVSRFAAEGIELSGAVLARMLEVSENIPYFLQAMASLSYQSVIERRAETVEMSDLDTAISRFAEGNEDYYEEILRNLAEGQRLLAEALAEEPCGRMDEAYRQRHGLGGISTVHSAIRGLLQKGVIDSEKGVYHVADPFFARYLQALA